MAFLTLLVCSLLVASSYSQNSWPNFGGYYPRPGGGGHGGGNSGGGSNTGRCTCNLSCVDVKAKGETVKCQAGYTAVSCSCGMSCGSYNFQGSNTCVCQCHNTDWTSARCCKNV